MREANRRQALTRFGGLAAAGLAASVLGSSPASAATASETMTGAASAGSRTGRRPGTLLWRTAIANAGGIGIVYGAAVGQSIAAGGDVAYVALLPDYSSNVGTCAISLATGKPLWQRLTAASPVPVVASSGAIYGIGVILVRSHEPAFAIVALNASDGRQLWSCNAGGITERTLRLTRQAEYSNGILICTNSTSGLLALDARTGRRVWSSAEDGEVQGLAVADGSVYAGVSTAAEARTTIARLDAATGRQLWAVASPGLAPGTLTVADGVVYGCAAGNPAGCLALDAATGDRLWQASLSTATAAVLQVAAGGMVFFIVTTLGGTGTVLQARHERTGAIAWTRDLSDSSQVTAGADVLYVTGSTGVSAIAPVTGQAIWTNPDSPRMLAITAYADLVLAQDTYGAVYAFQA
jgi:outer membrane protein assembly factor BamB